MDLKDYLAREKTEFGISALKIDINQIEEAGELTQLRDELVVSNKFGYMKLSTDEYTDVFIDDAIRLGEMVLEIGCAYGFVVQKVLEAGGKITACDIGERNLEILLKQTPQEYLKNLYVYPAKFPDELDFPENSFSAILASRVLHFLDGKTIEAGLNKMHKWLKRDGKLCFTAVSVEHATFADKIAPMYQENVKKGLRWRGEVENQHVLAPEHAPYVPEFIHAFDVDGLNKVLPDHGFKVEKIGLFNYPFDTTAGDTGHIGFVATKV